MIVDEVTPYRESSSIGVLFLREIVGDEFGIGDILFPVLRNLVIWDEVNCVGALDLWDAGCEASKLTGK